MKKIVIMQNIQEFRVDSSHIDQIKLIAPEYDVVITKNKADCEKHLPDAEIIIGYNSLVKDICLNNSSSLKWLHALTAGVDSLPLEGFMHNHVVLTNATGVHPRQVSETIFASMLALARGIPKWTDLQNKSEWNFDKVDAYGLDEIHGKTIGILGVGKIGEEVAKIARAFSMYTIGVRRFNKPAPYIDEMFTMKDLYNVMPKCDYIVNLLPSTADTNGIINEKAFNAMRDGTRYFAFGRGITTNTSALISALKSGKLAAAGIDVIDPEPLPADNPLWKMENVLISPHIAGTTPYYTRRVMNIFFANLKNYIAEKPLEKSVVNLNLGY